MSNYDIAIIGGGLAGLASAIHLSKKGWNTVLIEKNTYPKHKVCGEYISNEVLPYLLSLGFNPWDFGAKNIDTFTLSAPNSKSITTKLPLGGFSISRYAIDHELYKLAISNGTHFSNSTVENVIYSDNEFRIELKNGEKLTSTIAIGAYGKRSNLDIQLNRSFIKNPSPYLAVKGHYSGDFMENEVGLHNFKGGYCGISKVENNNINICYIASFTEFKKYKDIQSFEENVVKKNKFLKNILDKSVLVFDKPLTISQISFSNKNLVENHLLMCGDAAGMMHPLAGNGMGMAISTAQILSNLVCDYLSNTITSRSELEKRYKQKWNKKFKRRLNAGHLIAKLFSSVKISNLLMFVLKSSPFLLPPIIRTTHGKQLLANDF